MTERLTAEELKRWKDRLEARHTIPGFWQLTDRELGFFLAAAEECERLRAEVKDDGAPIPSQGEGYQDGWKHCLIHLNQFKRLQDAITEAQNADK